MIVDNAGVINDDYIASYLVESDKVIILSDWEFDELKRFLEKYIPQANVIECQTVGKLLTYIKQHKTETC